MTLSVADPSVFLLFYPLPRLENVNYILIKVSFVPVYYSTGLVD